MRARVAGLDQAIRNTRGQVSALVAELREVAGDAELVGSFFGKIEAIFGQSKATQVFAKATKVGLPVQVLHRGVGWEWRRRASPSMTRRRLLSLAAAHGDIAATVRLLGEHAGLQNGSNMVARILARSPIDTSLTSATFERLVDAIETSGRAVSIHFINACLRRTDNVAIVQSVLEAMRTRGISPNEETLARMVALFGKQRDGDAVESVLQRAAREGSKPGRRLLTAAALALARCGRPERVGELVADYRTGGLGGTDSTLRIQLRACVRCAQMREAQDILREIKSPQVADYVRVIDGLLRSASPKDALRTFEQMQDLGLDNDIEALNVLMRIYARAGHLEGVAQVFGELRHRGMTPSCATYSPAMDAYARAGNLDRVLHLLGDARRASLHPSEAMLAAVMKAQTSRGHTQDALDTFEQLAARGVPPTVRTVNLMLWVFAARGDSAGAWRFLERAASALQVQLNSSSYEALMAACNKARNSAAAVRIFRKLSKLDVRVEAGAFHRLLDAILRLGQEHQAEAILEEMHRLGVRPDAATFERLLRCTFGRVEEAERVTEAMERADVRPSKGVFDVLLQIAARAGLYERLSALVDLMRDAGFEFNARSLRLVMPPLLEGGHTHMAEDLFRRATTRDARSYVHLIRISADGARAEAIMRDAAAAGISSPALFAATISKLAEGGDASRAAVLWDMMPKNDLRTCCAALLALARVAGPELVTAAFESVTGLRRHRAAWRALVRVHAAQGDFTGALAVIRRCFRLGGSEFCDSSLYHELLKTLAEQGRDGLALSVIGTMRRRKAATNPITLSLLIDAAGQARRIQRVRQLVKMAEKRDLIRGSSRVRGSIQTATERCGIQFLLPGSIGTDGDM